MAEDLKNSIVKLITNDEDTIVNIKNILSPISEYINNPLISNNILEIVNIMITDRNNNKRIDINDLQLMVNDPFVVVQLVTSLLVVLMALPTLKITVNVAESEIVILKLLIYILLVIIPKNTNVNWTFEEKKILLNLSLSVFQTMQSLEIIKIGIANFGKLIKNSRFCSCLTIKTDVVEEKLPEVKMELVKAIMATKEKAIMQAKIDNLEKKLL